MTQAPTQKTLYQQDLVAWLDDTAIKLKQQRFEDIDIDSLIEIFPVAWRTALSDIREEYPEFQVPDEWQFSAEIHALLSEKVWESHE